jgi:hypothetical protein
MKEVLCTVSCTIMTLQSNILHSLVGIVTAWYT